MDRIDRMQDLAVRTENGERAASDKLRGLLAGQLHHIVRRTLRSWAVHSALDRRILAEAEQAHGSPYPPRPERLEGLVDEVTRRLSATLLRDPGRYRTEAPAWADTAG
jgi:hypothetical protein